ncbi:MAG: glycosyl hydrolase family 28 protein [Bacteroidales bacterium]|nr:glycosyl hydrolase family 28 protein [Bacteroidales bacterium]
MLNLWSKSVRCLGHLSVSVLFLINVTGCSNGGNVVPYPEAPGLTASKDFELSVNGVPVWIERVGSKLDTFSYDLYSGREMEDLNAAGFSFSGTVTVRISASEEIKEFLIRPKSRKIKAQKIGKDLVFKLTGPGKLYIEINDLPHLALFADPPETGIPDKNSEGVIWFGPGAHSPGTVTLQDNQTLYIDKGAVVYANIRGEGLENVKICGRGRLQGRIRISNSENLHVEGIFIRNTSGWSNTLTNCSKSSYRNVKVFGYEAIYSVDGINPVSCTNFTIDDCFMRCRDDCVAIKSINPALKVDSVFVTNNVMVGWACSDGVTIGFELNGSPVANVFVRNCDILYARGGGRTGGHSGFSIVCDGPAWVRNINYEDIRIEENVEFKNLEFIVTDGTLYGTDPPGHISGILIKNVSWENGAKPFILNGYSPDNLVENITFKNCRAGGKLLTGISDAQFRINDHVKNIRFLK